MDREIELNGGEVINIEQGHDGEYDGATIFDAGLVLIHYLAKARNKLNLENSSVIDIGSGTGVVGIAAAKLGANVTLSDLDIGQALLQKNIKKNFTEENCNCRAITLKW